MGNTSKFILIVSLLIVSASASNVYDDKSNVLLVEMNKKNVCLEDGTNCKQGLTQEIMIIKDVNLIGLTKTYCNITFIGGIANKTSC